MSEKATEGPYERISDVIWSPTAKAVIAAVSELRATATVEYTRRETFSPDLGEICANGDLLAASWELRQELAHLYKLLESYERDGSLSDRVPGLATLNGAREALRKARTI